MEFKKKLINRIGVGAFLGILIIIIDMIACGICIHYVCNALAFQTTSVEPPTVTVVNNEVEELKELNNMYKEKIDTLTNERLNDLVYFQELIEPLKESDSYMYYEIYRHLEKYYSDVTDKAENVYDYFTDFQIETMWKCIETETYQCPFEAKVNVANVILNRVESEHYPSDPYDIITADNQFSYFRNEISEETKLALEYAFMFGDENTNECVGFKSDKPTNDWNGWQYCYTDGYHYFYRLKD